MYKTIAEIKKANKDAGRCWFSKDTMKFFNSRITSEVLKGKYFITSERFDSQSPRLFTVRIANDNGHIDTVSEFQAFKSAQGALGFIKKLA